MNVKVNHRGMAAVSQQTKYLLELFPGVKEVALVVSIQGPKLPLRECSYEMPD